MVANKHWNFWYTLIINASRKEQHKMIILLRTLDF